MAFCLPKFAADALRKGLPKDLTDLTLATSEERRAFFEKYVGKENAKEVNASFESKLLLKDQQQGIINWAKKTLNINPPLQRDIITKINNMSEVLQPGSERAFLEDLAAQKLGLGVTIEEAGKIADLAKQVADAKAKMEAGGDRMEYGRAKVAFSNYLGDLKNEAAKKSFSELLKNPVELASRTAGQAKAIKASMDNSAIFRQGWKTIFTNPKIWAANSLKTFGDMVKTFGGKAVMDEIKSDIMSRPTYDQMVRAKLAVSTVEEAFPTSLPEKIPLLGRAYKASETAFTGFVYRMRADIFDKMIELADKNGVDTQNTQQLRSIGNLVNALTGRGNLGRLEPSAGVVNNIFFSPRFLKSHFDVLTAHQFQKEVTPFVRKQAAINLVKVVAGTAGVLAIANAIAPGSVEKDPRSADFGKIKIGDTRFDVSGGMGSVITLAARLLSHSTKSSTSGNVSPLDSDKFGSQTTGDVVWNFISNKFSPASAFVYNMIKGKDFEGNDTNLVKETIQAITPFTMMNFFKERSPEAANFLLTQIADGLGINTNTYSPKK